MGGGGKLPEVAVMISCHLSGTLPSIATPHVAPASAAALRFFVGDKAAGLGALEVRVT